MFATLLKLVLAISVVVVVFRILRKGKGIREADGAGFDRGRAWRRVVEMRREIAWGTALVACSAASIALSTGPNVNSWMALGVLAAVLIISVVIALL